MWMTLRAVLNGVALFRLCVVARGEVRGDRCACESGSEESGLECRRGQGERR